MWFTETLYPDWQQSFAVEEVYIDKTDENGHLFLFQNPRFGRILALDGIIQVTEGDDYVYHEMMAHVPLFSHPHPQRVLIIGGGDGPLLREITRHKNLEKITLVELSADVIEFSKTHLPHLSKGAFNDPRVEVVIADGKQFIEQTEERYDVIFCDLPDPIGPVAELFTEAFYAQCKRCLTSQGIVVVQNGVPFAQPEEIALTYRGLTPSFADVTYYTSAVPTYLGGLMAFAWASDAAELREVELSTLQERLKNLEGPMHYYTPQVHRAAFALPQFILDLVPDKAALNQ